VTLGPPPSSSLFRRRIGLGLRRVEGVERAGGIDERGARAHGDRHADGFGDLFPGGAQLAGDFGVHGDAAIAAQADGQSDRDELARLGIQVARLLAGAAQGAVAADCVRAQLRQFAEAGEDLLAMAAPIEHVHDDLLPLTRGV
jgi:hypothetical protein